MSATCRSAAESDFAAVVLPIVGANIVARREELGMSQRALCSQSSVDRVFLRDVEHGNRAPTVVFPAKLAHAL